MPASVASLYVCQAVDTVEAHAAFHESPCLTFHYTPIRTGKYIRGDVYRLSTYSPRLRLWRLHHSTIFVNFVWHG